MILKTPTLPWPQRPGAPPPVRAPLCGAAAAQSPAGLLECGVQVPRRLLEAAGGRGLPQAVSHLPLCSGSPSSDDIHSPATEENKTHRWAERENAVMLWDFSILRKKTCELGTL